MDRIVHIWRQKIVSVVSASTNARISAATTSRKIRINEVVSYKQSPFSSSSLLSFHHRYRTLCPRVNNNEVVVKRNLLSSQYNCYFSITRSLRSPVNKNNENNDIVSSSSSSSSSSPSPSSLLLS
mmetsp:Transcript_25624/g.29177  ORF Transcript_25624/g.29177 Transcript_25624/m.29177 type:complete len:125 (+) Transcript_25624:56-430(+)